MATACLADPAADFQRLETDYINQHIAALPGQRRPSAQVISEQFGLNLRNLYGGRIHEVLQHPRYRLHVVTSRERHLLGREHGLRTPLGYLGAFLTNTVHRKAMGAWLERVVFSSQGAALPFATTDYRTRQVADEANFNPALQASCSIPFMLKAVHNIPGAPPGAYWDGGITDYHRHLNYASELIAECAYETGATGQNGLKNPGLVLYPHFQKAVVPGWLDKSLKWRHGATHFVDNMVLLAPDPAWIKKLPNGKLPDRNDFLRYGTDVPGVASENGKNRTLSLCRGWHPAVQRRNGHTKVLGYVLGRQAAGQQLLGRFDLAFGHLGLATAFAAKLPCDIQPGAGTFDN